jgi:hypothetical protein
MTGMTRVLVAIGLCACGDNEPEIEIFEPTNGSRLSIEQYQFDDGTRLVQPTAFYDRRLHARCTPQEWIDGVVRCVPDAEEAFYREDTCDTVFGVGNAIKFATHFIATNTRDGVRFPALVFAAGARTDAIEQAFYLDGETCVPTTIPILETTTFWELGNFVGGEDLVPITEREIGDGRLGLAVRESDDGALVPVGFRDRDLDIACVPVAHGDGGACEPSDAPSSSVFVDNACTQPAILVDEDEAPAVASTRGTDGCRIYHGVDGTQATRAYRDVGGGCATVSTTSRVLSLGAPIELAAVTRAIDDAPKRRVQRIAASFGSNDGDLHVYATRMFDTATRAECELRQVGKTLRCLPTALAPIVRLFQPGCTVERRLAEVPRISCEPFAFAMHDNGETLELHAIGDPFDGAAFTLAPSGACVAYAASAGTMLFDVGPLLPDETFIGAVPFGAR